MSESRQSGAGKPAGLAESPPGSGAHTAAEVREERECGERIEHRLWERIPVEMGAELFPETHRELRRAKVLDLSWHGVRIRGDRLALKRGDSVDLVIAKQSDWHRRPARVVWMQSAGGHALEAGLEFV